MTETQKFKGDELELQLEGVGKPINDSVEIQLDAFFEGAYEAMNLGDVIYDSRRSPLANAIPRDIFRASFPEIYDAFTVAGTFESYITVFKKIFGDDVGISFEVPGPGMLNINIEADEVELSEFISRTISNNLYVYDNIVTQDDEQIVFQSIKGFKTQYELEQMLFEMVPAGIFTQISLSLG